MKTQRQPQRQHQQAFTMAELLVTIAVCVFISGAVVGSQLFGARMTELTQTKIHTSDRAAQLVRLLGSDIRVAHKVRVGQGSFSSFLPAPGGALQQGNALQINPIPNDPRFVRYYVSPGDFTLKRMDSNGSVVDVASGVTNTVVFTMEDHRGTVLSDRQRHAVIGLDLQFARLENPNVPVGPQHYYKSYRLRTRIAQPLL